MLAAAEHHCIGTWKHRSGWPRGPLLGPLPCTHQHPEVHQLEGRRLIRLGHVDEARADPWSRVPGHCVMRVKRCTLGHYRGLEG